MPYPEFLVAPMREELTDVGFTELRTAADVDGALTSQGTTLVVVNSVCGCAAGKARPGIARAMQHATRPDRAVTVFAGADIEATERARGYFTGYPPSSPSAAILRDGKLVYMMERHQIEGNTADGIAAALTAAFDKHCATQNA
ncbi:MAG: BrxA/BrxB family bacilliredoxin [Acidobacteria bacterium]|nr:BrxA/BrxB family bacilliredoxin [Acidobacteriota bacterium]